MPASLKAALADPFALGDEAAHLWRPPAILPPIAEIARGISILEGQLQRVDRAHATYCLAKLAIAFNERRTKDEANLVLETWLEVVGDVPNDLWSSATLELAQTWRKDAHFGRSPEASDFRAVVAAQMRKRETELARSRQLLKAATKSVEDAVEKPLATRLERLEHSASVWKRLNRPVDLHRVECEIAKERGEPMPVMAMTNAPVERTPGIPDSPATRAALLPARIRYWTEQSGADAPIVATLKAELRELEGHAPTDAAVERGEFEPVAEVEIV